MFYLSLFKNSLDMLYVGHNAYRRCSTGFFRQSLSITQATIGKDGCLEELKR
jgi:hypothetical protein